jgi:branched-subunit amino acid aminotransferase/4-amino-4-deoxychorismate lyase
MARSAAAFGIPYAAEKARAAVESVIACSSADMRVRLACSEEGRFACNAAPLVASKPVWTYAISPHPTVSDDELLRHKTNWRDEYEREYTKFSALGYDEVLFINERGELTEGSRTNIFVQIEGKMYTPPLSAGLLDGCLRREMTEHGRCAERTLTPHDLESAEKIWLGNSLRGLIQAERLAAK